MKEDYGWKQLHYVLGLINSNYDYYEFSDLGRGKHFLKFAEEHYFSKEARLMSEGDKRYFYDVGTYGNSMVLDLSEINSHLVLDFCNLYLSLDYICSNPFTGKSVVCLIGDKVFIANNSIGISNIFYNLRKELSIKMLERSSLRVSSWLLPKNLMEEGTYDLNLLKLLSEGVKEFTLFEVTSNDDLQDIPYEVLRLAIESYFHRVIYWAGYVRRRQQHFNYAYQILQGELQEDYSEADDVFLSIETEESDLKPYRVSEIVERYAKIYYFMLFELYDLYRDRETVNITFNLNMVLFDTGEVKRFTLDISDKTSFEDIASLVRDMRKTMVKHRGMVKIL